MTGGLIGPRSAVAGLRAYDPQHHDVRINLSANENSFGLPRSARDQLTLLTESLDFNRYPDPAATELRTEIAKRHGVAVEEVAVGNGGDELLQALLLAYGGPGRTAAAFGPTFVMYKILATITGTRFVGLDRDSDFSIPDDAGALAEAHGAQLVFACSPNNPTGNVIGLEAAAALAADTERLIVIDEAYQEFSEQTTLSLLGAHRNLAVLRTFSKAFALAGLRVGYLIAAAGIIENVNKVRLPYNVNVFSQAAATALLRDPEPLEAVIAQIVSERERLAAGIEHLGDYQVYPSAANFLLVRCSRPGESVWRDLIDQGILVRNLDGLPGLDGYLRITVGRPEENDAVIEALGRLS